MLDFVLACARKEPHYRIYFLAFAWYYAGKTLLRPDCDAPAGSATPEPFVSIPIFLYPSSPRNNYFCHLSSALWTLCKRHLVSLPTEKNWDRSGRASRTIPSTVRVCPLDSTAWRNSAGS